MYYPYFITYMVTGLTLSLGVFLWALKNGQFKDQERARYLPLEAETKMPSGRISNRQRIEVFALWGLVVTGLVLSAAVLAFSLIQTRL
jgi:cbb3-type cytochrome oxidase maturation protein